MDDLRDYLAPQKRKFQLSKGANSAKSVENWLNCRDCFDFDWILGLSGCGNRYILSAGKLWSLSEQTNALIEHNRVSLLDFVHFDGYRKRCAHASTPGHEQAPLGQGNWRL